jgi:hypothetical protein
VCRYVLSVGDGPGVPLKMGKSRLKPKKTKAKRISLKRAHGARPTPRWPPRPTKAAHSKVPSSRLRLARGYTPPSSGLRLARGHTSPSSGLRLDSERVESEAWPGAVSESELYSGTSSLPARREEGASVRASVLCSRPPRELPQGCGRGSCRGGVGDVRCASGYAHVERLCLLGSRLLEHQQRARRRRCLQGTCLGPSLKVLGVAGSHEDLAIRSAKAGLRNRHLSWGV